MNPLRKFDVACTRVEWPSYILVGSEDEVKLNGKIIGLHKVQQALETYDVGNERHQPQCQNNKGKCDIFVGDSVDPQ